MKWLIPLFFFLSLSVKCIALNTSSQDILVFSPHPDDETLACGGTILKNIQQNKKIKIVFLTNGEAYAEACSVWLKKKREDLAPSDFVLFGKERQREALQAIKKLGLKESDAIFLSFPDRGLLPIWEEKTTGRDKFYKSSSTKLTASPYKRTYSGAKEGYSRQHLISDLKDILKEYKPRQIYLPYPQDTHQDHHATAFFLNLVLGELSLQKDSEWLKFASVFYYLSHNSSETSLSKEALFFAQEPSSSNNILDFRNQKAEALQAYATQLNTENEKDFFEMAMKKEEEKFWEVPKEKETYLMQLRREWLGIARQMRGNGYNVNFAPVVDVADEINNLDNPLVRKQRIYSEDPQVVTELVSSVVSGMLEGKVIPVVKHFPGLGAVDSDTHLTLPKVTRSKTELYKKDLIPFRELIKKYPDIWIMIDHAVYSSLDEKPASLSFEIQTKLLRRELGFKGLIVVDELRGMQAIREYAFEAKIKEPFIGEIAVMAFQAGADLAIIYSSPQETADTILCVIKAVKQAVEEGRITEREINDSVLRILKEKEKIFGIPLQHFLESLPLEEKICQKLIFDCRKDFSVFEKYNIGGLRFYGGDKIVVEAVQKNSGIPRFIIGQHEGGLVSQYGMSTRSAYVVGREYERIVVKPGEGRSVNSQMKPQAYYIEKNKDLTKFAELEESRQLQVYLSLLGSIDKLIAGWSDVKKGGVLPVYLSPLTSFDDKPDRQIPELGLSDIYKKDFSVDSG